MIQRKALQEKTPVCIPRTPTGFVVVAIFTVSLAALLAGFAIPAAEAPSSPETSVAATAPPPSQSAAAWPSEERIKSVEQTLDSMNRTLQKAEERSYDNKIYARELISYVKLVVLVLLAIAMVFPLTLWWLSRRRLIGLSGLSQEVAATLLVVEERQAKLATVLKQLQEEIDYMHTLSVPDLKNLIQQAENYLKQSQADIEKAGGKRGPRGSGS